MYFEKVRDIIAKQLDIEAGTITMTSRLIDDLKADSLDIVELIMDLEQEFNIEIPDEELPKVLPRRRRFLNGAKFTADGVSALVERVVTRQQGAAHRGELLL